MKNTLIATLAGIALFLTAPVSAQQNDKKEKTAPTVEVVTIHQQQASRVAPEPIVPYQRGRSVREQKAERKAKKPVFRGSPQPLLIVHDF